MEKTFDDLIAVAREAWLEAQAICKDRDHEGEKLDPGQGPQCKLEENSSGMGWCEPGSCPHAADFQ